MSDWLRVPIGDPHWVSNRFTRTVLVVARTLTTTSWILDLLPELVPDPRVQVVFTIEDDRPSVYRQGALDLLNQLRIPVVPWSQAVATRFDLAIAASHTGDLEALRSPLLLLPHGPGFGKAASVPRDGRVPMPVVDGRTTAVTTAVVSHPEQVGLFDEAGGRVRILVAGDPVYDRLHASMRFRDAYRAAMGVGDERSLVVVTSTWGSSSLFAKHIELPARLVAELPVDEFAVAAILHPNIWIGHGDWQVRVWLQHAEEAGLKLVPPRDAWRAALVASDIVIGDHGSVILYAAAIGRPVLLAGFDENELAPESALAALSATAARLDARAALQPQIEAALRSYDTRQGAEAAARLSAVPGQSLAILQRAVYDLLGLDPPDSEPRPLPVDPPPLREVTVRAHLVHATFVSPNVLAISRHPAVLASPPPRGGGGTATSPSKVARGTTGSSPMPQSFCAAARRTRTFTRGPSTRSPRTPVVGSQPASSREATRSCTSGERARGSSMAPRTSTRSSPHQRCTRASSPATSKVRRCRCD